MPCGTSLLNLFVSYLSHCKQFVMFFNSVFGTSGVSQGSNFGPLLTNICVIDIIEIINEDCQLYADDWRIFCEIVRQLHSALQ